MRIDPDIMPIRCHPDQPVGGEGCLYAWEADRNVPALVSAVFLTGIYRIYPLTPKVVIPAYSYVKCNS